MKNKLKAIFFDHDGTLVNSEYKHYLHWKKVMSKYSVDFKLNEYILNFTGVPSYKNAIDLIEIYDLRTKPEILLQEKDFIEAEELEKQKYPLMPYALETLNYFKDLGLLLGVVSGANHSYVIKSLSKNNLLDYFEFIIGGDEVERSKPAPEVYLKAINYSKLDNKNCIAIEDTSSGIQAAISAGLNCIGVKSKYSETQDFSSSTVLVNHLREAREWIINNYFM